MDDLLAEIGAVSETPEEEFEGDYIESPEDTAERWNADTEGRGAAQPMREIVLMLKTDEFDEFADDLRTLKEDEPEATARGRQARGSDGSERLKLRAKARVAGLASCFPSASSRRASSARRARSTGVTRICSTGIL